MAKGYTWVKRHPRRLRDKKEEEEEEEPVNTPLKKLSGKYNW